MIGLSGYLKSNMSLNKNVLPIFVTTESELIHNPNIHCPHPCCLHITGVEISYVDVMQVSPLGDTTTADFERSRKQGI